MTFQVGLFLYSERFSTHKANRPALYLIISPFFLEKTFHFLADAMRQWLDLEMILRLVEATPM